MKIGSAPRSPAFSAPTPARARHRRACRRCRLPGGRDGLRRALGLGQQRARSRDDLPADPGHVLELPGGDRVDDLLLRRVGASSKTSTLWPRRRTVIRSATSKMSWRLCEMSTTARPRSASRRTRSSTCARLRDAERGGRLVEDHDLRVPHHRLRDRDRLALTAREPGDGLAHGAERRDRQPVERLPRVLLHARLVEDDAAFSRSRPRNMFATTSRLSASARSW